MAKLPPGCANCPDLRATVVELPSVAAVTQRLVVDAGAAERVRVAAADVVTGPLTGSFDVAVLNNLLQVLSPDQAGIALRNVAQVVKPGGDIFISGLVLDDSSLSPLEVVAFNLQQLNQSDEGLAHTEQEHRGWLAAAGFEGIGRDVLPNGYSIIKAQKQG